MNNGTKIRTALAIFTSINMAIATLDVAQFGNEKVETIYKIVSMIVNAIVVGLVAYYNNDYTEEACKGTGYTRQLKAEKKDGYVGERFYTEDDGTPIEADIDFEDGEEVEYES